MGNAVFFFYPVLCSCVAAVSYVYLLINRTDEDSYFVDKLHRFSIYAHEHRVWDWVKKPKGHPQGDPRRDVKFGWGGCFDMIGEFFCPKSDLEGPEHANSVTYPIRLHVGVIFAL